MRTIILILALCLSATAQTYIFGGGKAAAIVGPQATILPASCVTEGLLLRLTADDGVNKRGLYYCVNGTYTRSGFTGTEGRLLRFGATNAVGQTTALYEDGSGNVGIGTTNPGVALQVGSPGELVTRANARIGGSLGIDTYAYNTLGVNSTLDMRFGGYTSGTGIYATYGEIQTPSQRGIVIANETDAIIAAFGGNGANVTQSYFSGNVGIGTTSPQGKLEVVGRTNLISAAFNAIPLGLFYNGRSGGYYLSITDSDAPDLRFLNSGGGPVVTFQNGGNVGIGTTAPTAKLDVPGGIAGAWAAQTEGGCNTYTDLAVDATLSTKVTSASYNFVSADVGSWLDITAGGAWTGGRYVITAVAANAATLASSPAAVSSTAGTFILGRGKIVHVEGATDDTIRICRKASSVFGWQAM